MAGFEVPLIFALPVLVAAGISLALGKGSRAEESPKRPRQIRFWRLRSMPAYMAALLALAGIACIALPSLPGDLLARSFNSHPPLIGLLWGVFLPVGLFLFFRNAPEGREGFSFSLILAGSELLWALVFPLLAGPLLGGIAGGVSPQAPGLQAFHLLSLSASMIGGAGLCLAVSLVQGTIQAKDFDKAIGQKPLFWALFLIFAAGIATFALMGLHMGRLIPRMAFMPERISIPHFAFLVLFPLAGRVLDENPGKLMPVCVVCMGTIFCLGLARTSGLIEPMPLFYALNFMQQTMLLIAYTAAARFLKTRAFFPLTLILIHCLYLTQALGVGVRSMTASLPYGAYALTAASLLLASGAAFCLWRLRSLLAREPELWAVPPAGFQEKMPEPKTEPELSHEARLADFAATYGLSERETLVMDMLTQGRSSEEIAAALAVTANTVRTYVRRLMHKTGTDNRAELLARYSAPTR